MRISTFVLCFVWLLGLGVFPGHAERRLALVIGNDRYANLSPDQQLQKAVNDSRAVGEALRRIGFEVISGENVGRQAMIDKFDELTRRLSPGDTAFFFFAGHGVSIGGGNFILPADVPNMEAGQEARLTRAALGENDLIADLQARGARVAVVVLDACRNNPFKRPGTRGVGADGGLVRSEALRGVFTFYSAGIGQTALDRLDNQDSNPNSVFTRVLVPALTRPGLDLGGLAIEVREEVARLARTAKPVHDQRPAYYDETIGGRFYLAGIAGGAGTRPGGTATGALDAAERAWSEIRGTQNLAVLEEFVRRFGDSFYASLAKDRIDEIKSAAIAAPPPPVVTTGPCGGIAVATRQATVRGAAQPLTGVDECALAAKETFRECQDCPEMVVIAPGSFRMGASQNEQQQDGDEGPQHKVNIERAFAVGKFAVTFEEWDACLADGGCNGYRPKDEGWGRGRQPVINVSFEDARDYAAWLSRRTGKTYRLLTEAEREYVTRAGTDSFYWWGSTAAAERANFNTAFVGNPGANQGRTVPVDSFQPNAFGLYQVHGNVWDWTEDCYHDSYTDAPTDGSAQVSGDCSRRVVRGGSWYDDPKDLRSANRNWFAAGFRDYDLGFRIARALGPQPGGPRGGRRKETSAPPDLREARASRRTEIQQP